MTRPVHHITVHDCLAFENEKASPEVLQSFIATQSKNVFWFSTDFKADDESKLAEYDYRNHNWTAGRFVGEAIFDHKDKRYKVTIKPRFGEHVLFRMLEEIFNIRITSSLNDSGRNTDWQHYIKRIIAFIWIQKLANTNLHGLPKVNTQEFHQGKAIRGRLDVRKSINPLFQKKEVVSKYRIKQIDQAIAQILFQAYQILLSDFEVGKLKIPESAKNAINQVHSEVKKKEQLSMDDYRNIKYKDIYLSWKPVVDLSWDIIQRNKLSLKQENAKSGFGFFIDMAEVWEQYLRSILKKNLSPLGWRYTTEKQLAYQGYFFQRELIPDLVFQKDNDVAIWDAKYKRMLGRPFDVDRSDFFQIHTYILYQLNNRNVKSGGLLYPISQTGSIEKHTSHYLLNESGKKMKFIIDGIQLKELTEQEDIKGIESDFVQRILYSIS